MVTVSNSRSTASQPIAGAKTTRPFANCSMDLITDLPPINGYDSILVMVDQGLSKRVILSPCAKTITWEGITELLQDNLFKRFGLPDRIISDRDPRFAARAFQELLKLLNITSSLSIAYHPQTDGATEWVNQEIRAYLSIYCTAHPEEWLKTLLPSQNNMPFIKFSWSMPNLKTKRSRIQLDKQTHERWVWQLEEELEGMFLEYRYMNNPIKTWWYPSSITTINEILWNCLTND